MRLFIVSAVLVLLCEQYVNADSATCEKDQKLHYCDECVDTPLQCHRCTTGYVLNAKQDGCEKCPNNCANCTLSGTTVTCVDCDSDHFMKSDKTCSPCSAISGCIRCHGDNATATLDQVICDVCSSQTYLDSNKCESCKSGCSKCTATSCQTCTSSKTSAPKHSDTTTCGACPNCEQCGTGDANNDVKCSKCSATYYADSDGQCQSCGVSNCNECDPSNSAKCLTGGCKTHYYLDASKTCPECGWKCDVCTGTTDCTTCEDGYGPKSSTEISCDKCGEDCKTCDLSEAKSGGKCKTCHTKYALDSTTKKCVSCASNVANCKTCSSAAGTVSCSDCETGYLLADNACHKCPDNCKTGSCEYNTTHTPDTYCTDCDTGYTLDTDDLCTEQCGGCMDCDYNDTVSAVHCKCPTHNVGDAVLTGVADATRGYCSSGTAGYACKEGYYYDETAWTCTECTTSGCKSCNDTVPNQCMNCQTPTYSTTVADDGTCKQCTDAHSKCTACTHHDTTAGGYLECTSCSAGAYATNTTCTSCIALCDTCSSTTVCGTCQSGTVKTSDGLKCVECASPCSTCTVSGTSASPVLKCTNCINGYYPDSDACTKCSEHCSTCTKSDDCSNCDTYYGWNTVSKSCDACPANCTDCSYSASDKIMVCSTCQDGYTKNDKVCGTCPTNCESCKNNAGTLRCETCDEGYFLDGQVCTKCLSDCKQCSDASTCTKCNAGKSLSVDKKKCSSCSDAAATNVANCVSCTDSTLAGNATCMSCGSGFTIKDDNSACLSTTSFGDKCVDASDRAPNCTKCQNKQDFKWVNNQCQVKCIQCGVSTGGTVSTPNSASCNKDIKVDNVTFTSAYCPYKCANVLYSKGGVEYSYAGCIAKADESACSQIIDVPSMNATRRTECCDTENCNNRVLDMSASATSVIINSWLLAALFSMITLTHMD